MAVPFAAIAALTNGLLGIGQTNTQNKLLGMQISDARTRDRQNTRFAKATQVDALGNTTRYDEGTNSFISEAAPLVKAILDAQNKEQYKTLTEDAPRAREASKRKDNRSKSASAEYDKKFSARTGRFDRGEADFQADAVLSAARKRNSVPPSLFTAAIRSGNPNALAQLTAAARSNEGDFTDTLNSAKTAGTEAYLKDKSMRDQVDFSELGQLRSVADGTDPAQMQYNNTNENLTGQRESAVQRLMAAIQGGGSAVQGALGNAASNYKAPNIGALIESIGGFFPEKTDPNAAALAKAIQEAQLAEANFKTKDYNYRASQF